MKLDRNIITGIFAFTIVDADWQEEIAVASDLPLIANDEETVLKLRPLAQAIADQTGRKITLKKIVVADDMSRGATADQIRRKLRQKRFWKTNILEELKPGEPLGEPPRWITSCLESKDCQ